MNKWEQSTETQNRSDELLRLQREITRLQLDNKALQVRAQGVQVLGKVLQDSQESNAKLKQEIEQWRAQLIQNGVTSTQLADISVCTSVNDDGQSTVQEQGETYHSSIPSESNRAGGFVNVTTVSGPQSFSAGYPSLLPGEFHIKEIQAEYQHIMTELDQLQREAQKLRESVQQLPGDDRDSELQGKLTRLFSKLNEYSKEARTRETLSSALASEEEKLRTKLVEMEAEQASHENVVHQLRDKLGRSKEEMEQLLDEVKFCEEAVFVEREQLEIKASSGPLSGGSRKSEGKSLSDEEIIAKTPMTQTGVETCESCGQLQRQVNELQKQVLLAKAEKDEALKLKEEVLDVNYKWDEQYKLLVAASTKDIKELKNQIEMMKSSKGYGQLTEVEPMERKALDDRIKYLESESQQKQLEINRLQLLMRNQPTRLAQTPHLSSLEQPLSHLSQLGAAAARSGPPSEGLPSWPGTAAFGHQIPAEVVDQIEVLKQQLRVYADDFATEREDRERNQTEKEKLKEELDAMKEQVHALEQQLQVYEEDFKREKREKESLQQQLRAKQTAVGYPYSDPLAQKARAVAEQKARVQAIKEVHDRERDRLMRGQHDLQQHVYGQPYTPAQSQYSAYGRSGLDYTNQEWKRPPMIPRGVIPPTRGLVTHPVGQHSTRTSMYHGGEVYPDTVQDVIDSPSDGNDIESDSGVSSKDEVVGLEECPRCLRKFDGEDSDTILKHIERCIS